MNRTIPRLHARRGLTLIEVILAVTILSAGLTVMLAAAARCVAVFRVARNYSKAQWVLDRGELEHPLELVLTNDIFQAAVTPIRDVDGFVYEREVEPVEEEEELFIVRSRVTWAERGRERAEEVVRYVWFRGEDL